MTHRERDIRHMGRGLDRVAARDGRVRAMKWIAAAIVLAAAIVSGSILFSADRISDTLSATGERQAIATEPRERPRETALPLRLSDDEHQRICDAEPSDVEAELAEIYSEHERVYDPEADDQMLFCAKYEKLTTDQR